MRTSKVESGVDESIDEWMAGFRAKEKKSREREEKVRMCAITAIAISRARSDRKTRT